MPGYLANDFYLYDPTDQTKQLAFDVSANPTSSLSTLVIPNVSALATVAVLELSQTWAATPSFNRGMQAILNSGAGLGNDSGINVQGHASQAADIVTILNNAATAGFVVNKDGFIPDNRFTMCANASTTKKMRFDLSGIAVATTRTTTMQDWDGTIALDPISYDDDAVFYDGDAVFY